jgi:hypothetical protein
VISRDLSETLPHAIWFVNAGACPNFTSSTTLLVPVNKPKLAHPLEYEGGVKEWNVIRSLTRRESLPFGRCFPLREGGLNKVSGYLIIYRAVISSYEI